MTGRPVVFLGPSLNRDVAAGLLDAEFRAPVAQGDVLRALETRPAAIAIIDGVFTHQPTVRHREILWALAEGVPVFGVASMGALRAAELWRQGMIGSGLIYRWYRRFPLLADDAVAVTHAPQEAGGQALSAALVDLRRSLSAAVRSGGLDAGAARDLAARAAAMPFSGRGCQALEAESGRAGLAALLRRHWRGQKAADACGLLRRLAAHAAAGDWPEPRAMHPPVVHAWLDDLRDGGFDPLKIARIPK